MTQVYLLVGLQANTESLFDLYDIVWEWIWMLSMVLWNSRTQYLSSRLVHLLTVICHLTPQSYIYILEDFGIKSITVYKSIQPHETKCCKGYYAQNK